MREAAKLTRKDDDLKEKVDKARRQSEDVLKQKIQKTQAEIEIKDALAKQELEKMKVEQERRRNIKMIRQEAFELASSRQKKADEYKEAKLMMSLKQKDDRYQAIKSGYKRLEDMRREMHEAVAKTAFALDDEVHNLQHKDKLSPNTVAQKAMEVSRRVLFPSLSAKFTLPKSGRKKTSDENSANINQSQVSPADARASTGFASWDQFLSTSETFELKETNGHGHGSGDDPYRTRSTTAPVNISKPTGNILASLPKHESALDLRSSLSLKVMSPATFTEAVTNSKVHNSYFKYSRPKHNKYFILVYIFTD